MLQITALSLAPYLTVSRHPQFPPLEFREGEPVTP